MEKVTFNAKIKMPKVGKNPTAEDMETARGQAKIKLTIEGIFTSTEAGVLELLLKSWHKEKYT